MKLLAPIAAHLQLRTMSMFPYINGIFSAQDSACLVWKGRNAGVQFSLRLRFSVDLPNLELLHTHVITHLGALIDALTGVVTSA